MTHSMYLRHVDASMYLNIPGQGLPPYFGGLQFRCLLLIPVEHVAEQVVHSVHLVITPSTGTPKIKAAVVYYRNYSVSVQNQPIVHSIFSN